jgi:hypothetical protein
MEGGCVRSTDFFDNYKILTLLLWLPYSVGMVLDREAEKFTNVS